MKQNYLTVWLSACICMCLSLCGNASAQNVTSFRVQLPEFISNPEQLTLILSEISSEPETVEMYLPYDPETGMYETIGLEVSGNYLLTAHYYSYEEYVYVLPYTFQQYVVVGGTTTLDLRNIFHKCSIALKDYAGNPFPTASISSIDNGSNYIPDSEGKMLLYMTDGNYEYILYAPNYSSIKKSFTIAGADADIVLAFDKHRKVEFWVKDHKGEAMSGAYIDMEQGDNAISTLTNDQGVAMLFLTDGTYDASLSALGYVEKNTKIVVNSSIGVTHFTFEGYKRVSARVINGADTNVSVNMLYLYNINGDDDDVSTDGKKRDYCYAPPGVYTFRVNFDGTFARQGMVKISDADVEKVFDFSDYKKAIIECSSDIYSIKLYDPTKEDEDAWYIYLPDHQEGGNGAAQDVKSVEVYLPAGTYLLNGYETPQTEIAMNLTQSGQKFVYDARPLERIGFEVSFINAPVDNRLLNDWYAEFTPEGYAHSIGVSSNNLYLPAGNYTYSIEQEGYSNDENPRFAFVKQGSCRIDAANTKIVVDLKNYRCVNFNVMSPDGEKIEYPLMEIFRDGEVVTEVEGAQCLLEDGDYKVLVWEENDTEVYQKWVSFTVSGAALNVDVQFVRANTTIVFAEVRNEAYEPINDAELTLAGITPDYVHRYISLFTDIPCGENNYQIRVNGKQVQTGTIHIAPDYSNYLTFYVESNSTGIHDTHEAKLAMVQNGDKLMLYSEDGKSYTVSVYAMNGSKVLERNLSGDGEISTQSLGSGIYILKMSGSDGVKTFKFVKK